MSTNDRVHFKLWNKMEFISILISDLFNIDLQLPENER